MLQSGGATFYDAEGYFVKTPMVALVAVGLGIGMMQVRASLDWSCEY